VASNGTLAWEVLEERVQQGRASILRPLQRNQPPRLQRNRSAQFAPKVAKTKKRRNRTVLSVSGSYPFVAKQTICSVIQPAAEIQPAASVAPKIMVTGKK
jgi:hypothetical protein